MPTYSAVVHLGSLAITVTADTIQEVLQERRYLWDLDQAREGRKATPFYRDDKEGNAYYGFRRDDGAEVMLGRHRQPTGPTRMLFAYGTESKGYRGWERYDPEKGERIRVEERPGDPPAGAAPSSRDAAERPEPAGDGDAGEERSTAELTPDDYIAALLESAELLRDGVRASVGVDGVGEVRDVRLWVRENRGQLRVPTAYRAVSRAVGDLLKNHRNRASDAVVATRKEARELHMAHVEYLRAMWSRIPDAAQMVVGNRSIPIKQHMREVGERVESEPALAAEIVEAVGRATRVPFAALTGDAGAQEPAQQQKRTASGGRR